MVTLGGPAGSAVGDAYARLDHGWVFRSGRDLGAVGDGIDDGTASIQAAINYLPGSQGQKKPAVVFVPPGTCWWVTG